MAELEKLNKLAAYVGFQSGTPAKERHGDAIIDSDVDLLDVALWNELGTSTAPSRPFLRKSMDDNREKINAFCQAQLRALFSGTTTADEIMRKTSVFVRGLVQETIKEGGVLPQRPQHYQEEGL